MGEGEGAGVGAERGIAGEVERVGAESVGVEPPSRRELSKGTAAIIEDTGAGRSLAIMGSWKSLSCKVITSSVHKGEMRAHQHMRARRILG